MCNSDMKMILKIVIEVLNVIHFFVPIVLILFCTIDIFRIVITKKEDEIKKLRTGIFWKILYAIIIFVVPYLVPFILGAVDKILPMDYDDSWYECYNYVKNSKVDE